LYEHGASLACPVLPGKTLSRYPKVTERRFVFTIRTGDRQPPHVPETRDSPSIRMRIGIDIQVKQIIAAGSAFQHRIFPRINQISYDLRAEGDFVATTFTPLGRYDSRPGISTISASNVFHLNLLS
jgi:hypothetical protein